MLIFLGVRELLKAMENRCKVLTSTGEHGISSTNSLFAYHTLVTKITFLGSQPYISGTSSQHNSQPPATSILRSFRSRFFRSHRLGGKSRWTFVTRLKKGKAAVFNRMVLDRPKNLRVENSPEDFSHFAHNFLMEVWMVQISSFLSKWVICR